MQTEKDYSLQLLRAIAAIAVVLHHIRAYALRSGLNEDSIVSWIPLFFGYGAMLFFAISGYIMAMLINIGYKNFMYRRLMRIYPPFLIAVGLILILKICFLGGYSQPDLFGALTLLPLGLQYYPLNIEWTLVFEIFFYLVCWIFAYPKIRKFLLPFLVGWTSVILVAFHVYGFETTADRPHFETIFLNQYNLYFIFGAFTYFLRKRFTWNPGVVQSYITIAALTVLSFYIYGEAVHLSVFIKDNRFLFFSVIFAAIIYLMSNVKIKPTNPLVKVGDYSYGIYLVHAQIMSIAFTYMVNKGFVVTEVVTLFVLAVTMTGSLLYGRFEFFLHQQLKSFRVPLSKQMVIRGSAAIAATILILTGMSMYKEASVKAALYAVKELEEMNIIDTENVAGWVDVAEQKGTYLELRGWAIDPISMEKVRTLSMIVNGNAVQLEAITFVNRPDVAERLGKTELIESGYKIAVDIDNLEQGVNEIDLYASTKSGYVKLSEAEPVVFNR